MYFVTFRLLRVARLMVAVPEMRIVMTTFGNIGEASSFPPKTNLVAPLGFDTREMLRLVSTAHSVSEQTSVCVFRAELLYRALAEMLMLTSRREEHDQIQTIFCCDVG